MTGETLPGHDPVDLETERFTIPWGWRGDLRVECGSGDELRAYLAGYDSMDCEILPL